MPILKCVKIFQELNRKDDLSWDIAKFTLHGNCKAVHGNLTNKQKQQPNLASLQNVNIK